MSLSREERRAKELGETVVSALRDATAAVQSLRDDHGEQRHEEAIRALETVRTSVDALTAANQAQGEQSATFQNRSLLVQWCLFGATTAAFIAAAVYAGIAYKQKITMDRTFAEVKKQTNAAQDSTTAAQNAVTQSSRLMKKILGEDSSPPPTTFLRAFSRSLHARIADLLASEHTSPSAYTEGTIARFLIRTRL